MQGFEGFLLEKWSKKGERFLDSLTSWRLAWLGTFETEYFRLNVKVMKKR